MTRALGAEGDALGARGVSVRASLPGPVLLPVRGAVLYRQLRMLLREAAAEAAPSATLKLAILFPDGKSHAEVTVTVPASPRSRVLSRCFPRQEVARLALGFAEQA